MDNQKLPEKNKLKIVAIVVGVIIVLAIIGVVIYFATKKSNSDTNNPADTPSRKVLGGSCIRTSDCDTNLVCENNTCKRACMLSSDCNSGQTCQAGVCKSEINTGCIPACGVGKTCVNRTCVAVSSCTTDTDCSSNSTQKKCNNGTCVECKSDLDCGDRKICSPENKCTFQTTQGTITNMYRLLTTHDFSDSNNIDVQGSNSVNLQGCKTLCDSESSCKAFTRPANLDDNTAGICRLKKGPLGSDNVIFSDENSSTENPPKANNSWVKIPQTNSMIPDSSNDAKNFYLKSTNQHIKGSGGTKEDAYDLETKRGTVSQCIKFCDTNASCRGFNRLKSVGDNVVGDCYLKTTNVALYQNDSTLPPTLQYNSWVNISVPEQVVARGNVDCSGGDFCAQDWNNEFPWTWGGSRCAGTISVADGRQTVNKENCGERDNSLRSAICQRDDKLGYYQRSGSGCHDPVRERKSLTGTSLDINQTNPTYDYYKKANNIDDRILKLITLEPKSGGLDGPSDKGMKCNDWCGSTGYNYYTSGQNKFSKNLKPTWKNENDNVCLQTEAEKNGQREIRTCDERLGDEYTKNCVCLKRV
jgi:hypothetical protein